MTEEFILDLGQYVGANIELDLKKYSEELRPFLKHYKNLYRIWSEVDSDHVEQRLQSTDMLATTLSLEAISYMAEDSSYADGSIVTMHAGIGFMPIPILKKALALEIVTEEKSFIKSVIMDNEYQQEVLLVAPDKEFEYYGMWINDEIEKL